MIHHPSRLIALLLPACLLALPAQGAAPRHVTFDEAAAIQAGIRKLPGKRLVLYTDLPASPEIDRLPELFEQAFPQWCAFFGVDPARHEDWRMTGFLMKDKALFLRTKLLPGRLPEFRNGYSIGHDLWLYDQPSDYYRRHLLLHEGTHGFMNTVLGGVGTPWYTEGVAELLGTHRLSSTPGILPVESRSRGILPLESAGTDAQHSFRLALNYIPATREEVPEWGRIRIVKDAFAARRAMRLRGVIEYPPTAHLETAPYGWCWALAALLDHNPHYHDRYRQLHKHLVTRDVTPAFYRLFANDMDQLNDEWQVLVAGIEYGHDFARSAIAFAPGRPLPTAGATVRVAADRGWQSSAVRLDAGVSYRLTASGRYQVGQRPKPWWCEPGGVSIRYYQGRPLGILLAAVRPEKPQGEVSAFLRPVVVGLGATIAPDHTGTLYLKINHSAAELKDNAGELRVEVAVSK